MRGLQKQVVCLATSLFLWHCAAAQETDFVLSLEDCRRIALENNNNLKNARLDEKAARAKKSEVLTNYFPVINLGGFAFHSLDYNIKVEMTDVFGKNEFGYAMQNIWASIAPELGVSSSFNFLQYGQHYGATAIQPVFMGGRIVTGNQYAKLGIEAAQLKTDLSERNTLEDVDRNYYMVVSLVEKQKTLNALKSLVDTLDRISKLALENGVIVKADRLLLENKISELQNAQVKLRGGMRLAKMNLLTNIGMKFKMTDLDKYSFPMAGTENIPTPESVYVDEEKVVGQMEESRLLELQIKAKQYEKKLTLGGVLPQVGVGFTYGYTEMNGLNSGRWNGSMFAAFQVPLTDWAKSSMKMQQDQVAIEKATNDRNHMVEMLILQQRQFYLELTSAWDRLELARSQKDYNLYMYDQAMLNYEAGYNTMTDVLQAYSNLAEVNENYCNALSDYLLALQIYKGRIH